MLRRTSLLALLASLAAAGGLAAQEAEPAAPDATDETDERIDMTEIVCRKLPPTTGTRVQRRRTERVCLTRAEWEHQTDEAQAARRRMDTGTCGDRCNVVPATKF